MKPLDHDAFRAVMGGVQPRRLTFPARIMAGLAALAIHLLALTLVLIGSPPERFRPESTSTLKLFTPASPTPQPQRTTSPPTRPAIDHSPRRVQKAEPAQAVTAPMPNTSSPPSAPAAPLPAPSATAPAIIPQASSSRAPENAEAIRQAYARLLWSHIAQRRPAGISLSGTTMISFRLDAQGRLLSAEVSRASGNMLLDRLALRTVRMASPYPPPPAGLTEETLGFSIPFSFR